VEQLENAAALSPGPTQARSRRLRAAEIAFELGQADLIRRIVSEIDPTTLDPHDQARVTLMRDVARVDEVDHRIRVRRMLDAADQATAAGDSDLALNLLWGAQMRAWRADPGDGIGAEVVAATERLADAGEDLRALAILGVAGNVGHLARLHKRIRETNPTDGGDPGGVQRFLGMAAAAMGDFVIAEAFFASATQALRNQGRLGLLAQSLVQRSWTERETHSIRLAAVHADEGFRLAVETDQPLFAAGATVTLAAAAFHRGDDDDARAKVALVEQAAAATEAGDVLADLQLVRGVAALGHGHPSEAFAHLRRIFDPSDPAHHPTTAGWAIGDLVESAVAGDNLSFAREALARIESIAVRSPSPRLRLAVLRARPWVAVDGEVETRFVEALDADLSRWPFLAGRLHLAYGVWLRRQRRVVDAREHLRQAIQLFDLYGATVWSERAQGELRAAGETTRRHAAGALDQLTPQELQICRLAALGWSNREIGEQLYLSHRTVGFHLYRAYPKLGITGRGEIAGALGTDPGPSRSPRPRALGTGD
jgi:DNA-binding CsgD family transcriptional regulator